METETNPGLDSTPDSPSSTAPRSPTACELGGAEVGLGKVRFLPVSLGVSELDGASGVPQSNNHVSSVGIFSQPLYLCLAAPGLGSPLRTRQPGELPPFF